MSKFNPQTRFYIISLFFGLLICSLGVGYLLQVNRLAVSGLEMERLETGLTDIKETTKKLELTVWEHQSLSQVKDLGDQLKLVENGEIKYLSTKTEGVVLR